MALTDYSPYGVIKRLLPEQDYGFGRKVTESKPLINLNNSGFNAPVASPYYTPEVKKVSGKAPITRPTLQVVPTTVTPPIKTEKMKPKPSGTSTTYNKNVVTGTSPATTPEVSSSIAGSNQGWGTSADISAFQNQYGNGALAVGNGNLGPKTAAAMNTPEGIALVNKLSAADTIAANKSGGNDADLSNNGKSYTLANKAAVNNKSIAPSYQLSSPNPNYGFTDNVYDSAKSVFTDAGGLGTYSTLAVPDSTYSQQYKIDPTTGASTKEADPLYGTNIPGYSVNIDQSAANAIDSTQQGLGSALAYNPNVQNTADYSIGTGLGNLWNGIGGAEGLASLGSAVSSIGGYFNQREANDMAIEAHDAKMAEYYRQVSNDKKFSAGMNASGMGTRA